MPGAVRTLLRKGELEETRVLNDILLGIYLRLEALERKKGHVLETVKTVFLTDATDRLLSFPLSVPITCDPKGVSVVRAENLTTPGSVFYESVDIPNFSVSGRLLYIPFVTGLTEATRYRLTLDLLDE